MGRAQAVSTRVFLIKLIFDVEQMNTRKMMAERPGRLAPLGAA